MSGSSTPRRNISVRAAKTTGARTIRGKIVKINVAAGDRVTDGDTLIVFEAMKMQSNLKVVGDCTVREVLVCEGDPVATGQPLIKLDILTNDQNNE